MDYYRRMHLLSWLRDAGPGPMPPMFLDDSDQSCRQFKPVVATTSRVLHIVLRECSLQRLTTATLTFWILLSNLTTIPVPVLMEKLNPEDSFWRTGIVLLTVFVIFFIHIYQSAVVLDTGGLYSGPLIWKRYIRWEDVYKVKTWGRYFCLSLEAKYLCFRVTKRDRIWLEQTIQHLMRRT